MDLLCAAAVFAAFGGGLYLIIGLAQGLFLFLFTPTKMIVAVPIAIVLLILVPPTGYPFLKKVEVAVAYWLAGVLFEGLLSVVLRISLPVAGGLSRGVSHAADLAADNMSSAIEQSMKGDKAADEAYRRRQQNLNMQKIHEWDAANAAKKGDVRGAYTSSQKADYYRNKKD